MIFRIEQVAHAPIEIMYRRKQPLAGERRSDARGRIFERALQPLFASPAQDGQPIAIVIAVDKEPLVGFAPQKLLERRAQPLLGREAIVQCLVDALWPVVS